MDAKAINALSYRINGAAYEVHTILGAGMPERVYQEALAIEFGLRGLRFEQEPPMKVTYKGHPIRRCYHPDFIVENAVVVELKVVEAIHDAHIAQVLGYLKMSECPLGLILNFNETHLRHGICRVAGDPAYFPPSSEASAPSASLGTDEP